MTAPHKHTRPLRFARQPIDYERDPVAELMQIRDRQGELERQRLLLGIAWGLSLTGFAILAAMMVLA